MPESPVDRPVRTPPPRQFANVDELRRVYLRPEIPVEQATMLWQYAHDHGLELCEWYQDCQLFSRPTEGGAPVWWVSVEWSGLQRMAANTGLWMPGSIDIRQVGTDVYAFATCWTRYSLSDTQWVEVGGMARLSSYYERDPDSSDPVKSRKPIGDWALCGEVFLEEIAQYQAMVKALGTYISRHRYRYMTAMVLWYDRAERAKAADAGSGAQARHRG